MFACSLFIIGLYSFSKVTHVNSIFLTSEAGTVNNSGAVTLNIMPFFHVLRKQIMNIFGDISLSKAPKQNV